MGIKTTATYNGKPFDGDELKRNLRNSQLAALTRIYKAKIATVLTEEELEQITIEVSFGDGEHGECAITGPPELAKKAQAALLS